MEREWDQDQKYDHAADDEDEVAEGREGGDSGEIGHEDAG